MLAVFIIRAHGLAERRTLIAAPINTATICRPAASPSRPTGASDQPCAASASSGVWSIGVAEGVGEAAA
jgi:hypothetical protein